MVVNSHPAWGYCGGWASQGETPDLNPKVNEKIDIRMCWAGGERIFQPERVACSMASVCVCGVPVVLPGRAAECGGRDEREVQPEKEMEARRLTVTLRY